MAALPDKKRNWTEWLANKLRGEEPAPSPSSFQKVKLEIEPLEVRLVPAVYGWTTGVAVTVQVTGTTDTQVSAGSLYGYQDLSYAGTVAVYKDGSATNYSLDHGLDTATIFWGDGSNSTGSIIALGSNTFAVTGSHLYSDLGVNSVSVAVGSVSGPPPVGGVHPNVTTTIASGNYLWAYETETSYDDPIYAVSASLTATINQTATLTVATFSDSDPLGNLSQFASTITWGDGTSSAGTISNVSGENYRITGTHLYRTTSPSNATVSVIDIGGSTVSVSDPVTIVTALPLNPATLTEGVLGTVTLANYVDNSPNAGTDTALIYWGDSTVGTTATIVSLGSGSYGIVGAHEYYTYGTETATVSLTETASSGPVYRVGTGPVTVIDGAITGVSATINSTANVSFTEVVATFSQPFTSGNTADYFATISWGDGSSSGGTISEVSGDTYEVIGSHMYSTVSPTSAKVVIRDLSISSTTVTDSVSVATAIPVLSTTLSEGVTYTLTLSNFTDDSTGAPTDSAEIYWGDGSSNAATMVSTGSVGSLTYSVVGVHDYATLGTYDVTVNALETTGTITRSGTGTLTVVAVAPVLDLREASNQSSSLQVVHNLDLDTSPGTSASQNPALEYNLEMVNPDTVNLLITIDSTAVPTPFNVTGYWDGTALETWSLSTSSASLHETITLEMNVSNETNYGKNTWEFLLSDPQISSWSQSVNGTTILPPTELNSEFGAGWSLSTVSRLVVMKDYTTTGDPQLGVLRINGDGSWDYFAYNSSSGAYTSPSNDFGSLTGTPSTGWTYTATNGELTHYNTNGMETQWISADGDTSISATYSGTLIETFRATDGTVSTFNYVGTTSQVGSIVTDGRTVTLSQTSLTYGYDLNAITDPNGNLESYSYTGIAQMSSDALGGKVSNWSYSSTGATITAMSMGSGTETVLNTIESALFSNFAGVAFTEGVGDTSQTIVDPLGGTTWMELDAKGQLLEQIDTDGGTFAFLRNAAGLVDEEIDPLGSTTSFYYDSLGYLTEQLNPDSSELSYSYESASGHHELVEAINQRGITTLYAYDSADHVTLETDAAGTSQQTQSTSTYYTSGPQAGLLDAVYNSDGSLVTAYSYDSLRRMTLETDYTNLTTFTTQAWSYDANGNVATSVNNDGVTTSFSNDAMGQVLTQVTAGVTQTMAYNAAGQITQSISGNGNLTAVSYNSRGQVSQETTGSGSTTPVIVGYAFNAAGIEDGTVNGNGLLSTDLQSETSDVELQVDDAGNTTTFGHDKDGNVIWQIDPRGGTSSFQYNALSEQIWSMDADGITTQTVYDVAGNVTNLIDAWGTTTYVYDDYDRQVAMIDPIGITTSTIYDENGNISSEIDGKGFVTKYFYDLQGQATQTIVDYGTSLAVSSGTVLDGLGNVLASIDGSGRTTNYQYDAFDNVIRTIDAKGITTSQSYDGDFNPLASQVGTRLVSDVYDSQDRLRYSVDGSGNTTSYAYDNDGNTLLMITGYGTTLAETTSYAYNQDDQATLTITGYGTSAAITTSVVYDSEQNVMFQVTGITGSSPGETTYYGYDLDNYATLTITGYGTAAAETIGVGYDSHHDETLVTRGGQSTFNIFNSDGELLKSIAGYGTSTTRTTSDSYDNNGNQLLSVDALGHSSSNVYDGQNRLIFSVDADNHTTAYGYDNSGYMTLEVTGYGMTLAETTSYANDGDGNPTLTVAGYGTSAAITTAQAYDIYGEVTLSVTGYGTSSAETTSYAYDNDGNATLTITGVGTSAAETVSQSYDSNGNLIQSVQGNETTAYLYNAQNELVSTIKGYGTSLAQTTGEGYDSQGNQTVSVDALGHTTTNTYDSQNRLMYAVDGDGHTTSYAYDGYDNQTLVITGYGTSLAETTSYAYDEFNEATLTVTGVGTSAASTTSESFDANGNVLVSVTGFGTSAAQSTSYGYDNDGNVTLKITGAGTSSAQTLNDYYDTNNNLTLSVLNGVATKYLYNSQNELIETIDDSGSSLARTINQAYDSQGNQTLSVDALGHTTTNTYDSQNRLMYAVDGDGHTTSYAYDGYDNQTLVITGYGTSLAETTSYAYDEFNEATLTVTGVGTSAASTTSESYDANGNVLVSVTGYGTSAAQTTSYAYDNDGNATLTITGVGTSAARTVSQSYDSNNNLILSVQGGETTSYSYNSLNLQIQMILGVGTSAAQTTGEVYDSQGNQTRSVDALGHTTTNTYDSQNRVMYSVDGNGHTTSYAYDGFNNETLMITGYGTTLAETTSYAYDDFNEATLTITGYGTSAAVTTLVAYDNNGETTLSIVGSSYDALTTFYAYDGNGNTTLTVKGYTGANPETLSQTYDSNNNLILSIQGTETTSYGYDAENNRIKTIVGYGTSLAETSSQAYDSQGNVTLSIDAMGGTTSYSFDSQNQLVQTISINPTGTNSTISQSYDAYGNKTSYKDAIGNVTSWQYNLLNQRTLQSTALGNTSTTYNADDEVTSVIDAKGRTISYQYDGDGNQTSFQWITGGTTVASGQSSYNVDGQLTSTSNSAGTYSYQYDADGRTTQQVFTDSSGNSLSLNYTYDATGNLIQKTDSQGNTIAYVYNSDGLLATETDTSSTGTVARTQFTYNVNDLVTQIQDFTVTSGGTAVLTIGKTYDLNGNLTTEIETGSSGALVTYVNSYDADNRITAEIRNDVTVTYGYNAESQVTSAGSQTNSYDANGNLTNTGFTTGTYNEITSDGTWNYSYDAVGNMIQKSNISTSEYWVYSYDFNNRLTSAVDHASSGTVIQSESYQYDPMGNLVAETLTNTGGTTTTKFAYDNGNIYADLTGSGTVTTVYDTGAATGLFARIQGGTVYWIGQDYLESVREIINAAGTSILDAVTYTDSGGISSQTNSSALGNFGYTGLRFDSVTGFDVAQARWYNPTTGQWLEIDPAGLAGGLSNFRSYVGGNFLNRTDPSGLTWIFRQIATVGEHIADTAEEIYDVGKYVVTNPWDATKQVGKGIGHGTVITANRLTFRQLDKLDNAAQGLIAENGGAYQYSDLSAGIAAKSISALATGGGAQWATAGTQVGRIAVGTGLSAGGGVVSEYGDWSIRNPNAGLALEKPVAEWVRASGSVVQSVGQGIQTAPIAGRVFGYAPELIKPALIGGGGLLYLEGKDIYNKWDTMSDAAAFERIGSLGGAFAGGASAKRLFVTGREFGIFSRNVSTRLPQFVDVRTFMDPSFGAWPSGTSISTPIYTNRATTIAFPVDQAPAVTIISSQAVVGKGSPIPVLSAPSVGSPKAAIGRQGAETVAPATGGPATHNAANLAKLNAQLRLEQTVGFGRIVAPKGAPIAVGERRIAVFDTQTGKIYHSWTSGGRHAGVLEEHGLPLADNRYVGGWVSIGQDGKATFIHNSGTFPPGDLKIPRGRLDDMIRGTGANPVDG